MFGFMNVPVPLLRTQETALVFAEVPNKVALCPWQIILARPAFTVGFFCMVMVTESFCVEQLV